VRESAAPQNKRRTLAVRLAKSHLPRAASFSPEVLSMIIPRRILAFALAGAFWLLNCAPPVSAEDAPVDIHAAKHVKPPKDPQAPQITPAEAVAKANAYFDEARVMNADFVQIGPDGTRSEGELYVERPGKMLFKYRPPQRMEIVADGRSVAVRDQKLGTQDLYFIAQTPLKFLLADHIDLAKDTKVKRVEIDDRAATIDIEDKAAFGGAAEISLVFDPDTFELKQWTVLDAQGFQTVVTLFNVDLVTKPDPELFRIDDAAGPASGPRKR
jgi:outer membrane lipoprotein-sorting protein